MKSLHLTNYYHPASGGVRTFYHALLDAANRLRRPMRLVVPSATDSVRDYGTYGRIYSVAAPRAPFDSSYRLLYPYQFLPPFQGRIREILREERPDIIEISDKYTLCYLAGIIRKGWIDGLGRPLLIGASNERMDDGLTAAFGEHPASRRFAQWYMRRIYLPMFDYHVANSRYTAEEVTRGLETHRRHRFRVAAPGVETGLFDPRRRDPALRAKLAGAGMTLLMYAGRLAPEKNLPLLLDVAEAMRGSCVLVIAGDGPQRPWIDSQARVRRLPVRAIGHVASRAELAVLYASADVFLHPNPREPFGIGPLEAMASGCPVVLPQAGGVLTYATPKNSWLCEPQPGAFCAAVREILDDPCGRVRRVEAARRTAEAFRWERVAEEYFALLDGLRAQEEYAA